MDDIAYLVHLKRVADLPALTATEAIVPRNSMDTACMSSMGGNNYSGGFVYTQAVRQNQIDSWVDQLGVVDYEGEYMVLIFDHQRLLRELCRAQLVLEEAFPLLEPTELGRHHPQEVAHLRVQGRRPLTHLGRRLGQGAHHGAVQATNRSTNTERWR